MKTSQGHLRNLGGHPTDHRFKKSRDLNLCEYFKERYLGCPVRLKMSRYLFTPIQPTWHPEATAAVVHLVQVQCVLTASLCLVNTMLL